MRILLSIVLFCFPLFIFSQEIKIGDFKSLPLDVSARANPVIDANGDACAIIKVRTGLDSLRFSGDLEIRKIEKNEGEFWLWVSPLTHTLSIEAQEYGRLDYEMPLYADESAVYILDLLVILPDKVITRESRTAEIKTKPKNAQIFIDGGFLGHSPFIVRSPADSFLYEIRKKNFTTVNGTVIFNNANVEKFVRLKREPEANRMFLTIYTGGNKYGTLFYGIKLGQLGKTGWFVSLAPALRNIKTIGVMYEPYIINAQQSEFVPVINTIWLLSNDLQPDDFDVEIKEKNGIFYDHFRIKAGITQRIFKNTYLQAGIGYASSLKYYHIEIFPSASNPAAQIPENENYYLKNYRYEFKVLFFDAGISYCLRNHYMIDLGISPVYFEDAIYTTRAYLFLETSLGLGYRF